ncbi:MAG TPA: SH3 domain-containing protein [Xanthobacteraceae bacterium]|nr:SH3 domain-containing protein [Xanthobacteraceae bacterium]
MTLVNLKTLMTSAGVLALTTGFAAAAPAVVQSSVNLRTGPGTDYDVIAAMPGGATVDVMGCSDSWCRVNFDGTRGFASRGYLGIGGVAMGPAYERGYAYGGEEPGYRYGYRYGYEPGYASSYSESPGYGASVSYGGEHAFRGERELRGEGREGGGERTAAVGGEDRGQSRAAEIQGANPMLNPKNEAPAGGNVRAEGNRATANVRSARGTANATTGAGNSNEQDHGANFIGAGAKFRDNHP